MSAQTNPLARHGGLSYLHVPTREPQKSATFYQQVLGWKIDRRSDADFRFSVGDGMLIGAFVSGAPAPGFVPYFYVDGIEAAVERVTANGGEITKPPRLEGDTWIADIRDPAGNQLGLWQFAS